MQKVVRTYPRHPGGKTDLSKLLAQGYKVIMCNEIKHEYGNTFLEYIVEKDDKGVENNN